MRHPGAADLALFAGGDLGFADRWRIRRHLRSCDACRSEVDGFTTAAADLRAEMEDLPEGLKWDRLAAEMTANIHVGLEAAECVAPLRSRLAWAGWRGAAVVAAMSVLVLVAYVLNPPPRRTAQAIRSPGIEIRNTSTGLEVNENGSALVLLHGRGVQSQRPIILSSPGLLRARFVDNETGQITINNVYAE
jgi:hypothetical protein